MNECVCVCVRARASCCMHINTFFLRREFMTLKCLRISILKRRHTSNFRLNALTSFGNDACGRTARWKKPCGVRVKSSAVCSSDVGRTALTVRHRACGTAFQCGCGRLRLVMRCVCRRTSPLPSFLPGGDCDIFSDGNFG